LVVAMVRNMGRERERERENITMDFVVLKSS